jgi:hypothetical protein
MENIFRLVNESLARHNFDITGFDDQLTNSEGATPLSSASAARQEPALSERATRESRMGALARDLRESGESDIPVRPEKQQTLPSTSFAWGVRSLEANVMQASNPERKEVLRRPTPLPSGF